MIIGIDARVLEEGNGGVFVYTKSLLDALIPLAKEHTIKLFANRATKEIPEICTYYAKHSHVELHRFTQPNKYLNFSFRFLGKPLINKKIGGCDVYFLPSMLYGAWSKDVPLVLTAHDISFELFDGLFTKKQQLWHKLVQPKKLCERADHIISVSESTKQDIHTQYGIVQEKISTIHSGVSPIMQEITDGEVLLAARKKYDLSDKPFLIQVGTLEPRKNYTATIQAFEAWKKQYPEESTKHQLVLAGHAGWRSKHIFKAIAHSPYASDMHVIQNFDFVDLPALYSSADITLYPSIYEGFGFPPLESMACGTPVIASNNSSLGEIVGDAGILVDAHRSDDMVVGIHSLMSDGTLYHSLKEKGIKQAKRFDWEDTARRTLEVLEKQSSS